MRRSLLTLVLAAAAILALRAPSSAAELKLSGDRYWVVLASRPSADQAVAIARRYTKLMPSVVRADNGWFAAVVGPRVVPKGTGQAALQELAAQAFVPPDAYLSHGDTYGAVVWAARPAPVLASAHYDGTHDAVLQEGDLKVVVSKVSEGDGAWAPRAAGTLAGRPAFAMTAGADNPAATPAADVSLVRLDPASPRPQVVLTYFWQGAHCCTATAIATMRADGSWATVQGEPLDGEGGYAFEDLTGGGVDMIAADQAFYYAFASYADSATPTLVHRLVGDRIVDVTREPKYYDFLKQQLAGLEDGLKPDDGRWHDNGFLAGWVAAKMLVGQGAEAWARMLGSYDHNPDVGPEECSIDRPIDACPDDKRIRTDFPVALKQFLIRHHYILDANQFPTPKPAEVSAVASAAAPQTSAGPSALERCAESSDAARRLIYQSFVGRRMTRDESPDAVTLENDTTLEANDADIGRVVCAVTYDADLRRLVGQLTRNGEVARAEAIGRLMRRSGPVASARVKYSVKPTVTPGQSFVELLP